MSVLLGGVLGRVPGGVLLGGVLLGEVQQLRVGPRGAVLLVRRAETEAAAAAIVMAATSERPPAIRRSVSVGLSTRGKSLGSTRLEREAEWEVARAWQEAGGRARETRVMADGGSE